MSSISRSVGSPQEASQIDSDKEARLQKAVGDIRGISHPAETHAAAQTGDECSPPPRTTGAAAELIRDLTRRAAEQAEEVARLAAQVPQAANEMQPGQKLFETSSNILSVYSDAVHSTAADAVAVVNSFYGVAHGIMQYEQDFLDLAARSYQEMSAARRIVLNLKTPVTLARMGRDIYVESISGMYRAWSDMLVFTTRIAQAGMGPLQERATTNRR